MDILFRTIHGSRLYNLANEHSDEDYFTVLANRPKRRARYAKQTIIGEIDSLVMDLSTFMRYCDMGVPQALEAMFSPFPEESKIEDLRWAYRPNLANMRDRYVRTIKAFALSDDFKRRRHAFRLCLNLTEAMDTGRFNPWLMPTDAARITMRAGRMDYLEILERMMPCEGLGNERNLGIG